MKNIKYISLSMMTCIAIGLASCSPDKTKSKTKKPRSIKTAIAKSTRLVQRLQTTGDVIAVNTVTLRATVEGPIKFCPWREGDRIDKTGQRLIEIDRPLYVHEVKVAQAELAVAQATLADLQSGTRPEEISQAKEHVINFENETAYAKLDLDRIVLLSKKNVLSKQTEEKAKVDYITCKTNLAGAKDHLAMLVAGPTKTEIAIAQANVDKINASVSLAKARLNECTLTAPWPGVITQVYVRPGDLAILSSPRPPLLKMMDPSSLIVRAGIPESYAANIRVGTDVSVQLDAFPGRSLKGSVERVHPRLERASRTRIIEVRIKDKITLLPLMFARLSVQIKVIENAVVIPTTAIVTTPRGDKIVYTLKNGKANMRKINTGLEQEGGIEITTGIVSGEVVITSGNMNLKDGASVQVANEKNHSGDRK